MPKQVIVPINIALRSETLEALTANVRDVSPSEVISNRATQCLETIASGGVLLTPDQVAEIEKAGKTTVNRGQDIVSAVQKGHGIEEGANIIPITIDPTWMQPLIERAKECDRTVAALMSDVFQMALEGNWAFGLEANYKPPVYFPTYSLLQELTGKERPSGADVESAIREIQKPKRGKSKDGEAA